MSRKAGFTISLIVAFAYFLVKYAVCYEHSKFGQGLSFVVLPLLYFIPAFLFLLSIYLLTILLPPSRYFIQLSWSAISCIGAIAFVRSFYDRISISDYFQEWNTGYMFPKAEDFRAEYIVLLLCNITAILFWVRKKFS